jgi:hypothetical protein
MIWLPAWLGEAYCRLHPHLKKTLALKDAADVLGVSQTKATLILSRLAQSGWIERVGRGRYRVVESSEVFKRIAIFREIEENLIKIPQREFTSPLRRFMELVVKHYGKRLASVAVFGSLARGDATPSSDIDVLLVIEGLPKKIGERQDEISKLKLQFYGLREHWLLAVPISPLLYTPDEAGDFHNVYLDMTRHVVVLLDRNNLLTKKLAELSYRLKELESERRELDGKPVWVLKPNLRRGEVATL